MSRIRANNITNNAGTGAPTFPNGVNVTGIVTATSFSGSGASLTGVVPTAITVANESTDTTCFPLFSTAATGDLGPKTNTGLTFNSATGALAVTGALSASTTLAVTGASTLAGVTATTVRASTSLGVGAAAANDLNVSFSRPADSVIATIDNTSATAASSANLYLRTNANSNAFAIYGKDLSGTPVYWSTGVRGSTGAYLISTGSDLVSSPIGAFSTTGLTVTGTISATTGMAVGGATTQPGGVAFPATAVAVTDANTLDDYEEGTWTPTDASGAGLTLSPVHVAKYVKIGKLVSLWCDFNYPITASGSHAKVGGLPFTVESSGGTNGGMAVTSLATGAGTPAGGYFSTSAFLLYNANAAQTTNATLSNKEISFMGMYMASS